MDRLVDLHTHSSFSDGSDCPEALIKKAVDAGLSAVALTDHDTVKGVRYAEEAAKEFDIEVVPGVELSTYYMKHEVHIVGLYIDCNNKEFLHALDRIRFLREERNHKMCARLSMMGIDIDYDDLCITYNSKTITRAHIADYLLKNKYISTHKEAFEKYIGSSCPAFIQWEKISANEGIDLIKMAGGIPILAHPVAYKLQDHELLELTESLMRRGLKGIECYYSTNSRSFTDKSLNIARRYGLLVSGGSDYHGRTKPLISIGKGLGNLKIPYELLDKIKQSRIM